MNVKSLVMALLMGGAVWGCVNDEQGEGPCDRKKFACVNSCYKAGQGAACRACCNDAFLGCKQQGSYSFYACPDKDDP